ncbi:MAG: hypothetical protein ACJ74T_08985 [Pyrinomonadaceae bacterium]
MKRFARGVISGVKGCRAPPRTLVSRRVRDTYNAIRTGLPDRANAVVRASLIQFGACRDSQESADGIRNGLFTSNLLQVWGNGAFAGNYGEFFDAIVSRMPPQQQPNFFRVGVPSAVFESQSPFSL